jgi:hypothetical protein
VKKVVEKKKHAYADRVLFNARTASCNRHHCISNHLVGKEDPVRGRLEEKLLAEFAQR